MGDEVDWPDQPVHRGELYLEDGWSLSGGKHFNLPLTLPV